MIDDGMTHLWWAPNAWWYASHPRSIARSKIMVYRADFYLHLKTWWIDGMRGTILPWCSTERARYHVSHSRSETPSPQCTNKKTAVSRSSTGSGIPLASFRLYAAATVARREGIWEKKSRVRTCFASSGLWVSAHWIRPATSPSPSGRGPPNFSPTLKKDLTRWSFSSTRLSSEIGLRTPAGWAQTTQHWRELHQKIKLQKER